MADAQERYELTCLMDFYAPLLTEHQREVMRLYCEEDLSLAEIAEQMDITRQGVSDALNKARKQLTGYEEKLRLAARYRALGDEARRCMDALNEIPADGKYAQSLIRAREALENILHER